MFDWFFLAIGSRWALTSESYEYMYDLHEVEIGNQSLPIPLMCAICILLADGHHKLIRWRMVTHGAIDGFSRLIVFLQCSTNNRASTVYDLFLGAVGQYGLPSRVRTNQGREKCTSRTTHAAKPWC